MKIFCHKYRKSCCHIGKKGYGKCKPSKAWRGKRGHRKARRSSKRRR